MTSPNKKSLLPITALLTAITLTSACDSDEAEQLELDQTELTDELDEAELELLSPSGPAAPAAGITYQCEIDVGSASTNCNPALVDAAEQDPSEWTAKVIMGNPEADFRRMDIFAEICDPSGFAFAVADSPSTNGWGGDSGTTDHDAEAHFYNNSLNFFSTSDFLHGGFGNHSTLSSATAGGCQITHTTVYHAVGSNVGVFAFDGGNSPIAIRDTQGFKLDYVKCPGGAADPSRGVTCDYEDAARNDEGLWYFGLNRTVGTGSRDGTGVERACVILNEDVNAVPANCLDAEPVTAEPDGTRKMCISAGTPADMLAECEVKAQNNVNMFTSGTWSTQDYINQWGDPCPAGTSIVPGSQYYVANSCNPLPSVGVDCGGPGSFNYEFVMGVQCQ